MLIPKILPGRNPRRAGVYSAATDKRTLQIMYVTFSRVRTQLSCKTSTRGSARPPALQDQVTLQGSILRSRLQDEREPRPTKVGLTLMAMSSASPRASSLENAPLPPGS